MSERARLGGLAAARARREAETHSFDTFWTRQRDRLLSELVEAANAGVDPDRLYPKFVAWLNVRELARKEA